MLLNMFHNFHGKLIKQLCFVSIIIFPLSLNLLLLACEDESNIGILSTWVQMGASGDIIARVIAERLECPLIKLNDSFQEMQVRAAATEPDFPVLVCEIIIPPETDSASIEGRILMLPNNEPKRLAIIGDTGCRIAGDQAQACNDPRKWPFKRVAKNVAAWGPDLVIHIGDYVYREAPCPEGNSSCAGSPFGDNWDTWDADFFSPASSLLKSAPWVIVRGNHEMCAREGNGWFRFLSPNVPFSECQDFTDPYPIDIGEVTLLILDSANADDNDAPENLVSIYSEQIAEINELADDNSWLLSHRPIWGIGEFGNELFRINLTLQAATNNNLAAGINLVLSGHQHLFEKLSFVGGRAPQLIVGNSGTFLDSPITVPLSGLEIAGVIVDQGVSFDNFGFVTMERIGDGWNVSVRDVNGVEIMPCVIVGNHFNCSQN